MTGRISAWWRRRRERTCRTCHGHDLTIVSLYDLGRADLAADALARWDHHRAAAHPPQSSGCGDCEEHQDIIAALNAEAQAATNRGDRWRLEDDADRARGWYELHVLEAHPQQAEQRRQAYEDAFHAHLADREEAERDG